MRYLCYLLLTDKDTGAERLSALPKVTPLASGRAGIVFSCV